MVAHLSFLLSYGLAPTDDLTHPKQNEGHEHESQQEKTQKVGNKSNTALHALDPERRTLYNASPELSTKQRPRGCNGNF